MSSNFKPDKNFFKYVKDMYSKKQYGYTGYRIADHTLKKLLSAAYGLTAWITTKKGAEWAFKIAGIEKQLPLDFFDYYYASKSGEKHNIDVSGTVDIFRVVDKSSPSLSSEAPNTAKKVVYTEGWDVPDESVFTFVFSCYRAWLAKDPGLYWMRERFTPIDRAYQKGQTVYSLKKDKKLYWIKGSDVVTEPTAMNECEGCGISLPCSDHYDSMGNVCISCYSQNFADAEMLKTCTRPECMNMPCPNALTQKQYERKVLDERSLRGNYEEDHFDRGHYSYSKG